MIQSDFQMAFENIPYGEYCYTVLKIRESESLDNNVNEFGFSLRQFKYHGNSKEVLCPYWRKTNSGFVICDYLGVISIIEDEERAIDRAIECFGSVEIFNSKRRDRDLYDEIKCCEIHNDWIIDVLTENPKDLENVPDIFFEELAKYLDYDEKEFENIQTKVKEFLAKRLLIPNPTYKDVMKKILERENAT